MPTSSNRLGNMLIIAKIGGGGGCLRNYMAQGNGSI